MTLRSRRMAGGWTVVALLCAAPVWAQAVGKVKKLQGSAERRHEGVSEPLSEGAEVMLGDLLVVAPHSRIKIQLNDESLIALDERSQLSIDEATFEGQTRRSFSATLGLGKFWTKVKKLVARSDSKFEVHTDKAVAGVRGTIFRIDALQAVEGAKPSTTVWVKEGVVRVTPAQPYRKGRGCPTPRPQGGEGGPRRQVPGPRELSAESWETRFTDLQKGMAVQVGEEITCFSQPAPRDDFQKFIDRP